MTNHLHLFVQTPQPNLLCGMQHFLSSYANWFCRRHRRPGHLLQGRFKAELVEDESYYWEVSRYVHLNPMRRGDRWSNIPKTGPGLATPATMISVSVWSG